MAKNYKTIPMSEVRARYNPGKGRHWFDRDSMRFFNSKLPTVAYQGPGGVFFVSSEQMNATSRRNFTVRELGQREDGEYFINTIGDFQGYWFAEDAREQAKKLANEPKKVD